MIFSNSFCEIAAKDGASGQRAKRAEVTWFTLSSVHWAERMVAISSCSGVEK
jgi:hypothetical protein